MGVSKEETRAAANQMSEYESEDDYAQEMEAKKATAANEYNTQEEPTEEEQMQQIEDKFKELYEKDPELRAALEKSNISNLGVE